MTITIGVDKHVKHYLERNVFVSRPYVVTPRDIVGVILIPMLEPKRRAGLPLRYSEDRRIDFELREHKGFNYKVWLPKWKARYFNDAIEKIIKNEFYQYVTGITRRDDEAHVDKLIREFEDRYDLANTNLSFSTLKRMYYRTRKRAEGAVIPS